METFVVALQQCQSNCHIVRNDRLPGLPSSEQKIIGLAKQKYQFLIFVVPCIILIVCEISPTRCNNCIFILRNSFYSTCFGRQSYPSSGVHMLYMATGKLAHCKLTNSICYNNNITI
jgi:hypothetical protein